MNKPKSRVFYLLVFNEDWSDEHDVPALACMNEKEFKEWKEFKHRISAHLGNGGNNFMEKAQGASGSALIKNHYVKVKKVSPEFKKTFDNAGLADLSLSNVFENEECEEEDEEEYEDYHNQEGRGF